MAPSYAQSFDMNWTVGAGGAVFIPIKSGLTYNYDVDWGDGSSDTGLTGGSSHSYGSGGTYTVKITGTFPSIDFSTSSSFNRARIQSIEQWGNIAWETMNKAFYDCDNLEINASDAPDLSGVTNMDSMFYDSDKINQDISHWNVSMITSMVALFERCDLYNQPLNSWNVGSVTNMRRMFYLADDFNFPLNNWNVSSVTDMNSMFGFATSFNQSIDTWNVGNVTDMGLMFRGATAFDQSLNSWDVSKVNDMGGMFQDASIFNGNISSWNVASATSMNAMFASAPLFNQNISAWNVANVTNMSAMFFQASVFNQDLSAWNVAKVTDMSFMFYQTPFNHDIRSWDVTTVSTMESMFFGASSFDQNLGDWDVSNILNLFNMFSTSGMSLASYDSTLIGWSTLTLSNNAFLGASGVNYCTAASARQYIIDTYSWTISDGGESCTTSSWDGAVWDNGTPDEATDVTIDGFYNASTHGNLVCRNLTTNTSRTLIVPDGNTVVSAGNLINNGNVIVQEAGAFVQTAIAPTNTGTGFYIVERNGANFQHQHNFWSSPLQSITINDVFGSGGQLFYSFDATAQSWQAETTATTMAVGVGYTATGVSASAGTVTRTFANNSGFNSGDLTVPLIFDITGTVEFDWNLVGNPYPSGLDVTQFLTDNSAVVENAIYLWSSDGDDSDGVKTDYATMNAAGTVNAGGSGVAPTSATVSSCQGFFVVAKGNVNLTFRNRQRITTNNTFQRTSSTKDWQRIWLGVTLDGQYQNEVLLNFTKEAQQGEDHFDAKKISENPHLSFYTYRPESHQLADKQKLIIQGIPHAEEATLIPLGLEAKTAGNFTFNLKHAVSFDDYDVQLIDTETGKITNILTKNYTVDLAVGTYESRFVLHVSPHRVTALPEEEIQESMQVYSDGKQLYINVLNSSLQSSKLSLIDLSGRTYLETQINHRQKTHRLTLETLRTGIYLVKLDTPQGIITRRILVN